MEEAGGKRWKGPDPPVSSDQQAIQPSELYDWVRAQTPDSAEAVFIGGNGFRAIGVVEALEENLNRPVLTANQVAFWQALALSGYRPVGHVAGRFSPFGPLGIRIA